MFVLVVVSQLLILDRVLVFCIISHTSAVAVVNSARDLGVIVDSELTMADHVAAVCRAGARFSKLLRKIFGKS